MCRDTILSVNVTVALKFQKQFLLDSQRTSLLINEKNSVSKFLLYRLAGIW